MIFWSDIVSPKNPNLIFTVLWHAAACFKTPTNRPQKQVLRHASTVRACLQGMGMGMGMGNADRAKVADSCIKCKALVPLRPHKSYRVGIRQNNDFTRG